MKIISLLVTCYLLLVTSVFASENDIGYSRIDPASSLYFLKAVRENLELNFAQTGRVKMLRQLEFATRRLREARTLVSKREDFIQPTLERYISYLSKLPDNPSGGDEVGIRIKESLTVHSEVLEQIHSQATDLKAKMAIRSAMNRLIQRADVADKAKIRICDFFSKEASSSALNQTEQVVLSERAQKCFDDLRVSKI